MINLAFAYFIFTIDDHNNIKKVDKITHINKLTVRLIPQIREYSFLFVNCDVYL
jgi:hypothetical protein